ncbi:MAG: transglutaminase-like domain-containing protein [Deltaproteobacteria bacterium]|nr:transglutaminase-like domain-containing protein [Deltaproteobacteria bacterium]
MHKIKWNILWGVFITFAFLMLLFIRLEFFQKKLEPVTALQISKSQLPRDTWMNIYQNNKKIGFVHRTLTTLGEKLHFNETVFMQINTMGITQALNILTEGDLNPDTTLSSFNFNLNSSMFRFNARGYVANNKLILFTGMPNAQRKSEIPLKDIPHISGSIYDAAFHADLEKDTASNFSIFDPSTMSIRAIKVTRSADEIIPLMGKRILTKKYCADFMGAKNCAWLSKEGDVLKETGILGISMEKVSPQKAREGISDQVNFDLTQISSIPSNVEITEPEKLREIKIKIGGISGSLLLDSDRQKFQHNILTITKENLSSFPVLNNISKEIAVFLKPSPLMQSDDPQIKAQAGKIIKPTDTPEEKARKIVNWAYRNLEKKPALSVPNALEVLKNKSGDCNEHSVLTVALLRAAGIPAQIEAGLVYLHGRFYYHAWVVFYSKKWITADAVFNQLPADVTHIRLVRGDGGEQLNLIGVIGKIKLEVLEQRK